MADFCMFPFLGGEGVDFITLLIVMAQAEIISLRFRLFYFIMVNIKVKLSLCLTN
jgi:hypothetical protein